MKGLQKENIKRRKIWNMQFYIFWEAARLIVYDLCINSYHPMAALSITGFIQSQLLVIMSSKSKKISRNTSLPCKEVRLLSLIKSFHRPTSPWAPSLGTVALASFCLEYACANNLPKKPAYNELKMLLSTVSIAEAIPWDFRQPTDV